MTLEAYGYIENISTRIMLKLLSDDDMVEFINSLEDYEEYLEWERTWTSTS